MVNPVHTPFGPIVGVDDGATVKYLGIPYAKPPIGDLRFREPQLIDPWQHTFEATKYAKNPMQFSQADAKLGPNDYSEDCLYLNIWVPKGKREKLPVMVWIPGGAFNTGGSGAERPNGPSGYECATMAQDTGCIIVTISYRLNVFGFLNFSKYSSRFDDNLGMKDMIVALQWVNRAIASFGGDPDNITLFGESAGGEAVSALMLVNEAVPLFHKAIIQSNCFGSFHTPEEEEEVVAKYLEYVGLDTSRVDQLLDMPYEPLLEANEKLVNFVWERHMGRCAFCPVVDGKFITNYPTLDAFEGLNKPVLVGSNKNEGNFQVFFLKFTSKVSEEYTRALLRQLTPERREAIMAEYSLPSKQGLAEALTDVMYTVPKIRFAEHLSKQGQVYVYRYEFVSLFMKLIGLNACHVTEMIPLFDLTAMPYGLFGLGAKRKLKKIGLRMRRYWGAFAREGVPNVPGQVEWKPYDEKDRFTLLINETDSLVSDAEKNVRIRYEGIDRLLI